MILCPETWGLILLLVSFYHNQVFSSVGHITRPILYPWWDLPWCTVPPGAGRTANVLWFVFPHSHVCLGTGTAPLLHIQILTCQLLFRGGLDISRSPSPFPHFWAGIPQCAFVIFVDISSCMWYISNCVVGEFLISSIAARKPFPWF